MRKIALLLSFVFLLAGTCLFGVHVCAQDDERYFAIQKKIGLVSEESGLGRETVKLLNEEITAYLSGESDEIAGVSIKAFMHMEDVRDLILKSEYVSYALFAVSALMFLLAGRQCTRLRAGIFSGLLMIAVILIPVFKRIDFHGAFIWFHETVFDDDSWILDPVEDLLIRILPEEFFSMMAFEVIRLGLILYLAVGAGAILTSSVLYRRRRKL